MKSRNCSLGVPGKSSLVIEKRNRLVMVTAGRLGGLRRGHNKRTKHGTGGQSEMRGKIYGRPGCIRKGYGNSSFPVHPLKLNIRQNPLEAFSSGDVRQVADFVAQSATALISCRISLLFGQTCSTKLDHPEWWPLNCVRHSEINNVLPNSHICVQKFIAGFEKASRSIRVRFLAITELQQWRDFL